MDKIIPKSEWPQVYLDWVNNFLTVPVFAEHYGITIEHAHEIIGAGHDSDNFTKDPNIKYSIVHLQNGLFRPQREYGNRMMFPAFDTVRDAIMFMRYTESDFIPGIVGNVRIIEEDL